MEKSEHSAEYTSNIRDLLRFLTREGESGYAFVTATHEGIIPAVNRELMDLARQRGKTVELLWYEDPEDLDLSFAEQLRQAAKDADAVIVNDLDRAMRERPHFIDEFNFSREAINALEKPVLFWLTPESLSLVGNRAADLFSQRRMMTVQFEDAPDIMAAAPELERRFTEDYRSKEDYEALKTRVNLLKKQLNESLEAGMPRRTIAADIALPLAKTYSDLDLHEEALGLLEQFKENWDEEDARELFERGGVLAGGNRQKDAIDCLQRAQGRLEQTQIDPDMLGNVHVRIGNIYREIGNLPEAQVHYEANLAIRKHLLQKAPDNTEYQSNLETGLHFLAVCFEVQGKLAKALALFEEGLEIREKLHLENPLSKEQKRSLAISFHWIGRNYETQGKLNKALEFFEKNRALFEELYHENPESENIKRNLAVSYARIGAIYQTQGKSELAMVYFEKDVSIMEELQEANPLSEVLRRELAISYGWLGSISLSQGQIKKALSYYEKRLPISEALCFSNPLSEDLKIVLANSYYSLETLNDGLGKWHKSIYWSWKGLKANWQLCSYVHWKRHKFKLVNAILNLVFTFIIFPPFSVAIWWIGNKIELLYKRLRYGLRKPTPPPTF